jgi:hypothetical protein
MPWVFEGMDARMNKAGVRAGLEARRLEAARLLQTSSSAALRPVMKKPPELTLQCYPLPPQVLDKNRQYGLALQFPSLWAVQNPGGRP